MSDRRCPNCGSKSGVHSDPEKDWCFACETKSGSNKSLIDVPRKQLGLPSIEEFSLPVEIAQWIEKYHLSRKELKKQGAFWSTDKQRLCFPYYIYGEMRGCWMRSLDKQPKWLFAGNKDFAWVIVGQGGENVCIVEDVVSAIRVSKVMDCICLGGTSINDYVKEALTNYSNVYIFLDGDDAGVKGADKIRNEIKLTHKVKVIRSRQDPKEFDEEWLREILL